MADAVETMAYAYDATSNEDAYSHPWHKSFTKDRSVPVHPDMSPEDMLVKAGLDWEVKRRKAYVTIDGKSIYTGTDALYRERNGEVISIDGETPQILTMIPDKWQENQNESFVDFFQGFCQEGSAEMNTMGSLEDGRVTFAMAKLKQDFSIIHGKDQIENYLLFVNPHQYGKSISISSAMTRTVCMNTLLASLREDSKMSVRVSHRKKFDVEEVKQLLEINTQHMTEYKEAAEYLASKRFSVDAMKEYYQKIFPASGKKKKAGIASRNAMRAVEVLDTQPGAELGEGSWWQVYNGATYLVDHELGNNEANRLRNSLVGTGRSKKIEALNVALEMA